MTTLVARYQQLRDRGLEATHLGRLVEAKAAFSQAAELAADLDEQMQDRAFCNLASSEIELQGDVDTIVPSLRAILVKGSDLESSRLAAYHLARSYELRSEYKKALFYARVAKERSERAGILRWIASSHNQMGQLLLAESRFPEARVELEQALGLMPKEESDRSARALIKMNLGYCLLVQKEYPAGFRLLFDCLRVLRRLGVGRRQSSAHEMLCFGYLEIGRLRTALRHGLHALRLAEEHQDQHSIKNALYLLGEAANLAGDTEEAYAYFAKLQEQYFPEHRFLADFLLAVDVRGLVNLRA